MAKTKEDKGYKVPQQTRRLKAYAKNLSKDKNPNFCDKRMIRDMLELALNGKWMEDEINYILSMGYTQSKYEYAQIEKQISNFEEASVPWFGWNKNYQAALEKLKAEAISWRLKSLQYGRNFIIEEAIPREDSHAGYEYIVTGYRKKGEYLDGLLHEYEKAEAEAKTKGTFENNILIGTRTQSPPPYDPTTGERTYKVKPKSRLVSMVRLYLILAEMRFAHHVQRQIGITKWYAGGKSTTQQANIINQLKRSGYSGWISIDYSQYDQTISSWIIRDVFEVIRLAYSDDPYFDGDLFNIIVNDFINKTIIDGNMRRRTIKKGVPSGSMFTQIIDSLVNKLMIMTFMEAKGIEHYEMFIMGDDNLVYLRTDRDLKNDLLPDMEGYLKRNFGIIMNASKSSCGSIFQSPEFLSRRWDNDGEWRAPGILLAKLIQPERFRDYKRHKFTTLQIIQSYVDEFPKGMAQLIDMREFERRKTRQIKESGPDHWRSGLNRFKYLYENKRYTAV